MKSSADLSLIFTNLLANSEELVVYKYFFLFFPENRIWCFMQIVSSGDNLHETSNPVFLEKLETTCMKCQILFSWKNKKNAICDLLNFLPSMLSLLSAAIR